MVINAMTQKDVQCGLKRGLGIDEFCSKYECTERTLRSQIHRIYKHDADKIIKRLSTNTDNNRRRAQAGSTAKHSDDTNPTQTSSQTDNCKETVSETLTAADQLTTLKQRERQLSDTVISIESQHKDLARQHRERLKTLRDLNAELEQLKQAFEDKFTEFGATVYANNLLVAQMNNLSQQRTKKITELTQVRDNIKRLTEVFICAYDNGNIEPMDSNSACLINEAGSDSLFASLRDREDLEDLRIKDIRILSRVLAITRNAEMRIVPIFDNVELDHYYQLLRNAS